jgi:hypothetical protein
MNRTEQQVREILEYYESSLDKEAIHEHDFIRNEEIVWDCSKWLGLSADQRQSWVENRKASAEAYVSYGDDSLDVQKSAQLEITSWLLGEFEYAD